MSTETDTKLPYRNLGLFIRHKGDDAEARVFAVIQMDEIPPESPYPGRINVAISPQQARDIIATLWRQLPPEERPCPR